MMNFGFSRWTRKQDTSARAAKERLQILLAHERAGGSDPNLLPDLQRDILAVIRRHMKIDDDAVDIRMERGDNLANLEINIEFPEKNKA